MEGKPNGEVVLFGSWASGYCTRVKLALKVKGIPYRYVEVDLKNKSELLIQYNPVHKKVPVLVHDGKPIAESLVILEYIDEEWNQSPKLFPEDPYYKAKVRFWVNYYDQKISPATYSILLSGKDDQKKKAIDDFNNLLGVFDEGVKKDFQGRMTPSFNGNNLGLLDIIVAANGCNHEAFHEVSGHVIGPEKNPEYYMWVKALKEHPMVVETLPPHDKLVARLKEKFPDLQKN